LTLMTLELFPLRYRGRHSERSEESLYWPLLLLVLAVVVACSSSIPA
jgi:hypothetical protein